jgi:DNA-directed RNA polymerase subunit RPC12/RpoP
MDKKYRCTKCKQEYDSEDIRFTGQSALMCVYCLGKKQRQAEQPKTAKEEPQEENVNYFCNDCRYSFKRRASFKFNNCPYCGKSGSIIVKKPQTAEKLITDSVEPDFDF